MVHVAASVGGMTCRRHVLPLHPLELGNLLLQEVVEQHYLVLELETGVVCLEEVRVLLLKLLPYQLCEAWLHFGLLLQVVDHLRYSCYRLAWNQHLTRVAWDQTCYAIMMLGD